MVRGCLRQVEERRAREAAEQAARDSQERFRAAVETMLDGLAIFSSIRDRSGRITDFRYEYVNKALSARSAWVRAQLIGKRLLELFPAHIESGLFADYCEVVESGEPLAKEDVVFREERGVRRLSLALDLRAAKLGDGVVVVAREITARKQAEAIRGRLAAIVESSDDAVISVTLDGEVVSWNVARSGYTATRPRRRSGVRSRSWLRLVARTRSRRSSRVCVAASASIISRPSADVRMGAVIDVRSGIPPIVDDSGEVIGASSVARDVTERKQAE